MKIQIKMIIIAVIAVFIVVGTIGCTKEEAPEPSKSQDITEHDNESIGDTSQEQNSDEESSDSEGKLVSDPQVDVVEGVDYLAINVSAEDFELKDLKGNTVKLSDYEGQIIFLNFWATWCPPCRAEMPDMQEIYEEYGNKGVAILAVSSTQLELRGGSDSEKARQQVEKFINENSYTFPVLLDADDEVAIKYNNIYPLSGIPTTFMIDKEGQIRYARPGAFAGKEQMKAFIALLDE